MRRREFIAAFAGSAFVASRTPASAQELRRPNSSPPVVLFVSPAFVAVREALRRGLARLGYAEGDNIIIDERIGPLTDLSHDIASRKVDMIFVAGGEALRAARASTQLLPIVAYDLESDPVEDGYASSFARPGKNVTGIFLDQPYIAGKLLQYLVEAVPSSSKIAAVWDARTASSPVKAVEAAASKYSLRLDVFNFEPELDRLISRIKESGAQGIVLLSSPVIFSRSAELARIALRTRTPVIFMFPEFTAAGGLLSYGPVFSSLRLRSAHFVSRVLKGEQPAEIPLESPAEFRFVVNLKTAHALDLAIPPTLLARADEVIE